MITEQKLAGLSIGRVLLTGFLLLSLFGLAFALSLIFLNEKNELSPNEEIVPKAEIKLPKDSPTPTVQQPTPKVKSQAKVGEGCKVSGCNSELCLNESDEVATTTCVYKKRYECYFTATCEKQENGKCDWTTTQKLSSCISQKDKEESERKSCGGIMGITCPQGYTCKLDGDYPDASGACFKEE